MATPFVKQMIRLVEDEKLLLRLPEFKNRKVLITIERAPKPRSLRANRYYFGALVRAIAGYTGMTVEEVHELFKLKFNPKQVFDPTTGEIVTVGGSTRKMNSLEFSEFTMQAKQVSEFLGIKNISPEQYWQSIEG